MNITFFDNLREANNARKPQFKNKQGELSHPPPYGDGSNWSPADWMVALTGEVGEAANLMKKIRRGDYAKEEMADMHEALGAEFADIAIYLDILAQQCGINLQQAVISKFNEVSRAQNIPVHLAASVDDVMGVPPADQPDIQAQRANLRQQYYITSPDHPHNHPYGTNYWAESVVGPLSGRLERRVYPTVDHAAADGMPNAQLFIRNRDTRTTPSWTDGLPDRASPPRGQHDT